MAHTPKNEELFFWPPRAASSTKNIYSNLEEAPPHRRSKCKPFHTKKLFCVKTIRFQRAIKVFSYRQIALRNIKTNTHT